MSAIKPLLLLMFLCAILFIIPGCSDKTIDIGFVGSLSTKNSQLSVDARNTLQMAVDEYNASMGAKGLKINLVVKDDEGNHEGALEAHEAFQQEGISLIIGHMTSNMTRAVLESQGESMLFLSPTMGSYQLTGLDDFFIRTSPLTDAQATLFEEFVKAKGFKEVVVFYDLMNEDYTQRMVDQIKEVLTPAQGFILKYIPFDSRQGNLSEALSEYRQAANTEVVLMISQAIDTALLAQRVKEITPNAILCSVSWSMTEDLLHHGGKAVENMYFIGIYQSEEPSQAYKDFKERFYKRYNYQPSFVCLMAYDAFQVLVKAIESSPTTTPKDIKEALIGLGDIQGLDETYTLDAFGDNNRKYLMYQLINGLFQPQYNLIKD